MPATAGSVRYLCTAQRGSSIFVCSPNRDIDVHPRVLEQIVCSIFKDLGYKARVTAYSADGGVDVILDGANDNTVGVQVKRYKQERRIEAEQIRSPKPIS